MAGRISPAVMREAGVRAIVAEVCGRTFGGTTRRTSIRVELDVRGAQEDAIARRIEAVFGVVVPPIEWAYFRTVGQLADYVELQIQRREAQRG